MNEKTLHDQSCIIDSIKAEQHHESKACSSDEETPDPKRHKSIVTNTKEANQANENLEHFSYYGPSTPFDGDDQHQELSECSICHTNHPRSLYSKKQWNKRQSGGCCCIPCLQAQTQQISENFKKEAQSNKRDRHEQKRIDHVAKSNQTFDGPNAKRRCLICKLSKAHAEYSNKQWKQLYRECVKCVKDRQLTGSKKLGSQNKLDLSMKLVTQRICCSCRLERSKNDFHPKQWKSSSDVDRMCKDCINEENQAKILHLAAETEEKNRLKSLGLDYKNQKRCFACHEFKTENDFSGKQWKKSCGVCSECVVIVQDERRSDVNSSKHERVCFYCSLKKNREDYAREQWKRPDRRCRACAAEHVKEREEHRLAEKNELAVNVAEKEKESTASSRRCFQCKTFKDSNGFSGRQWTKTFPTCTECSTSGKQGSIQECVEVNCIQKEHEVAGCKESVNTGGDSST